MNCWQIKKEPYKQPQIMGSSEVAMQSNLFLVNKEVQEIIPKAMPLQAQEMGTFYLRGKWLC